MAEQQYQQYEDQGFVTIILMVDAAVGGSPEPVEGYATNYGLTMPVLNDPDTTASSSIGMAWDIPYYALVGRDMTHLYGGGSPASDSAIAEALAEDWPEVDWPENPVQEEGSDLDVDGESPAAGSTPFSMTAGPGSGEVLVCSVGERRASPWALLALAALFALRRRA